MGKSITKSHVSQVSLGTGYAYGTNGGSQLGLQLEIELRLSTYKQTPNVQIFREANQSVRVFSYPTFEKTASYALRMGYRFSKSIDNTSINHRLHLGYVSSFDRLFVQAGVYFQASNKPEEKNTLLEGGFFCQLGVDIIRLTGEFPFSLSLLGDIGVGIQGKNKPQATIQGAIHLAGNVIF